MKYDIVESGKRIRLMRKSLGLTQEKLAEKLGISREHLTKIETGMTGASIDLLIQLSVEFDCTLDDLVIGVERREAYNRVANELLKGVIHILRENGVIK